MPEVLRIYILDIYMLSDTALSRGMQNNVALAVHLKRLA